MDLTQFAFGASIIIGFVNGVNMAIEKDWKSFAKFTIAVVAGSVFGYMGWFMIPSLEIGFALAVASSGVYKLIVK